MLKSALLSKLGIRKAKRVKKDPVSESKKLLKTKTKAKSKPKIAAGDYIDKNEKFDEEIQTLESKFNIKADTAKKAVRGIITLTAENPKLKNRLFDEQFPLFLQINSIKVPKIQAKIVRIPLKHSVLTPDCEVCLIVPDVKGIPNKNHDEHVEYYEQLLRKKDVTNIKKIMTFHEFRTEYENFELKRRLVELYDFFLVDGRISGKTVKKCGKIFYTKRKIPTAVKLQATKLKDHIEQTLKKTPLYLHGKGDSFMVQIGHSKMDEKQIVENIFYLLQGLDKAFPGGVRNIRNLNLFTFRGITVPIYTTLKNQNQVTVPKEAKKTPVVDTVKGEISTRLNSGVIVKPTGEVKVYEINENSKEKKKSSNSRKRKNENL